MTMPFSHTPHKYVKPDDTLGIYPPNRYPSQVEMIRIMETYAGVTLFLVGVLPMCRVSGSGRTFGKYNRTNCGQPGGKPGSKQETAIESSYYELYYEVAKTVDDLEAAK